MRFNRDLYVRFIEKMSRQTDRVWSSSELTSIAKEVGFRQSKAVVGIVDVINRVAPGTIKKMVKKGNCKNKFTYTLVVSPEKAIEQINNYNPHNKGSKNSKKGLASIDDLVSNFEPENPTDADEFTEKVNEIVSKYGVSEDIVLSAYDILGEEDAVDIIDLLSKYFTKDLGSVSNLESILKAIKSLEMLDNNSLHVFHSWLTTSSIETRKRLLEKKGEEALQFLFKELYAPVTSISHEEAESSNESSNDEELVMKLVSKQHLGPTTIKWEDLSDEWKKAIVFTVEKLVKSSNNKYLEPTAIKIMLERVYPFRDFLIDYKKLSEESEHLTFLFNGPIVYGKSGIDDFPSSKKEEKKVKILSDEDVRALCSLLVSVTSNEKGNTDTYRNNSIVAKKLLIEKGICGEDLANYILKDQKQKATSAFQEVMKDFEL